MTQPQPSPARGSLRVFAFFVVFGAALFAVDRAIFAGLRRVTTSDYGVWNKVMNGRVNTDIIVTGSSRALVHYDSNVLSRITGHTAYNIGLNGSQTDMQLAFLKSYLRHNAKPKLIIHNLDLHSCGVTHDPFNLVQYVPYLDEDVIYAAIQRYYPEVWKAKRLPLYGYVVEDMHFVWARGLLALGGVQPAEDRFLGFAPRDKVWNADFGRFKESNPDGVRFNIDPLGVKYLTELAEICRAQNIALLFVYSPEYYEAQELEINRGEVFAKFHEIGAQFRVPVWDYSNSPISRDHENFYNSQHLNARAAEAFTTDLADRIVKAGLLQHVPSPTP